MKKLWIILLSLCAGGIVLADSPATQSSAPSDITLGEWQVRANEDMAKGDYVSALPMLQKISQNLLNQPDQLGPILEQIRVCQRQIDKMAAATQPAAQAELDIDGHPRTPHPAQQSGTTLDLAIKQWGNFQYDSDTGGNIPPDVKNLEGVKIKTQGYMIPLDQAESISNFALVPSLFACCFGQPPQIQHTIVVTCPQGKAVSYCPDELIVEGTLHVSEQRDGGFIVSIFQLDASSVRPVR
jgi:hypothetical protein